MKNAMNQAEPSMMTWQMGVKFGKMEKEMEDLRGQINKISNENGQLKKENETMKNHIVGGTNGQQMLKFDSIELKKNKMDLADRARKLSFAEDELLVTSYDNGFFCFNYSNLIQYIFLRLEMRSCRFASSRV
jgi:regulator of replication initiation timing